MKKQLILDLINQTLVKLRVKQVIVIRKDLKMGAGKISAQSAHAAVLGFEQAKKYHKDWVKKWLDDGQAKIVVKVTNIEELNEVKMKAERLGVPVVEVRDMGLTQVDPGTLTCIGLGPAPSEIIDMVTANLKLL
jgi:PTH2 family peptidyl-tRNA hydrolase